MRIDYTTYDIFDGKEWVSTYTFGSIITGVESTRIRNVKYWQGLPNV